MNDFAITIFSVTASLVLAWLILWLLIKYLVEYIHGKEKITPSLIGGVRIQPRIFGVSILTLTFVIAGFFNHQFSTLLKLILPLFFIIIILTTFKYAYDISWKRSVKLSAALVGAIILILIIITTLFWSIQ